MKIIAIDPGNVESAWVVFDTDTKQPVEFAKEENSLVGEMLACVMDVQHMAIEGVASYGMPVGMEVFDTCEWIGRLIECWNSPYTKVFRKEVKLHLCGNLRAKDSNVLQALYDRYGPGRKIAVGTKKNPGPCYGMSGDIWSALAVAITYTETRVHISS